MKKRELVWAPPGVETKITVAVLSTSGIDLSDWEWIK